MHPNFTTQKKNGASGAGTPEAPDEYVAIYDSIIRLSTRKLLVRQIGKSYCDALRSEIAVAGLNLRSAQGDCQLATLPKVLRYLGARGLGTVEGEALGKLCINPASMC